MVSIFAIVKSRCKNQKVFYVYMCSVYFDINYISFREKATFIILPETDPIVLNDDKLIFMDNLFS